MRSIAIDGPAGAGKSTLARAIAKNLGYIYVDTGALYRAVALHCLRAGVQVNDPAAVEPLLRGLTVRLGYEAGEQRVYLGGEDVSNLIRTPEVSMATSTVSALGVVRDFLFSLQQNLANEQDVVMDGRDIGTVVLPGADIKIFLTASVEERANRRILEYEEKGIPFVREAVIADIRQRDHNDAHRAVAPLKQAADAILVDTTGETMEQSLNRMLQLIKERLSHVAL